jgi:hypothetical protein
MAGHLPHGITQADIDAHIEAGQEPPWEDFPPKMYECDCCGKVRELTRCSTSCGIETFACDECRGL